MTMKTAGPFVGMVMAECAQVGVLIVSKVAMKTGMSNLVFVLYSNSLAALVILPCLFIFHRPSRPPPTFSQLCSFFLLGLVGCCAQMIGYAGIKYSSPTLATAMLNLVPAFTFILAIIFGMEKLDWRSSSSLAKCVGTIVSITGASVVTFYKGPPILTTHSSSYFSHQLLLLQLSNWVIGGFLLAVDCVLTSSWIIVQAKIVKKYPVELVIVFYYFFFVAIQSAAICLIVERDSSAWSLKPTTRFMAILYSGVFGSVFQVGICTWCLQRTGPVFVSMFKPLGIAISVVAGVIFFGDAFYLGSLVGATVIVIGFYSVLWGISKEETDDDSGVSRLESTSPNVPLLENNTEEI